MATVNLGRIKPVFRGAYNNSTAYVIDDIVTSGNETFIAIAATQGNATSDASKWTKLAAKGADGADGTDVAATLANKEISFKTNAGALDGIPIGNAGEFLKVNSGATGYEFGAVSSDFVKLAQIDLSSNPAQGNSINGYFSSTYPNYKLVLNGVHMASGNSGTRVGFYFMRSGSNLTSNNTYILMRNKVTSSSQGWGESQEYAWDSSTIMRITQDNDNAAAYTISGTFYLFNVNETNRWAQIVGTLTSQNYGGGDFYSQLFAGRHNTTGAMSGIHIRSTADTLNGGTITLYGMK